MRAFGLLALLLAPLALAAKALLSPHEQLKALADASDGVIRLDDKTYDLLTAPQRNWSATVLFTAMDKRRRCGPCRYVGDARGRGTKAADSMLQGVRSRVERGRKVLEERAGGAEG